MSKIRIYGYGPEKDNRSREEREKEENLLYQNLKVILANSKKILETEEYFFCQIGSAFLSMPYIEPSGHIPLGALIQLWNQGKLTDTCTHCGGIVYIIGVGGSLLSGQHEWWGGCSGCNLRQVGEKERFILLWRPMTAMLKRYPNKPIIEKGTRPVFSWREGLKGEYTPDRVIKDRVRGVSLQELVEQLRGGILS